MVIANAWFSGMQDRRERQVEQQKLVNIVVAAQPMEFGTKITPPMLRLQSWPANSVPQGAFTSIPAVLKDNRVALRPIVPNEPVLASKVSGSDGRATLAAVLPDGMAAYSISVDAVRGVAGFVLPGTMVDVLLTRDLDTDGASKNLRSDVILRNVQVLAVDQLANDKEGKPKVSRTATLAVSLYDAQRLSIAHRMGTLSLALRKVEDGAVQPGEAIADAASPVTSRQVAGGPLYIVRRPAAVGMPRSEPVRVAMPRVGPVGPPAASGPTMTVVRGTEPTIYPLVASGRN